MNDNKVVEEPAGLQTYSPRAVHAFRGVSMEESRTGDWYMRTDVDSRIAELEAQLAAAQGRERWIPASEAPPKNGPYLILFKGKVVYATFLTNGWYQWYYANRVVPDAWRELPAPPEEAADAE